MTIPVSSATPIAIVGMACRLPGADNLDQFWELLRAGRSAVAPLPPERFDRAKLYDPRKGMRNRSYTDLGCTIVYRRPRGTALPAWLADHPERAFVALGEVAAGALLDAGWPAADEAGSRQRGSNVGVYLGNARQSGLSSQLTYATYVEQTARYLLELPGFVAVAGGREQEIVRDVMAAVRQGLPRRAALGGAPLAANVAARLIATTYGFRGPYMTFNAACASSLHALVQAVRAIQLGRIEAAVVGGGSYFHSDTLLLFSQAQSLSARGSSPFDADADGLVVGEGYVAVVLKPLADAVRDGDRVRAVICGLGLSSDGRGKSLWAPRREGQLAAIRRAYPAAPLAGVQYIEAHATSTQLGDATEAAALGDALQGQPPRDEPIAIGSVKANIGHTLEAAGLASLAKTVLALEHRYIPPAINVRRLNPRVDWDRLPLFVPTLGGAWERPSDGRPRRAAVSAFGIGGLNVHVVIEQGEQATVPRRESGPMAEGGAHAANRSVAIAAGVARPTVSASPLGAPRSRRLAGEPAEPIAVIGRGVVCPGALSVTRLWELLLSGCGAIGAIPPERWEAALYCTTSQEPEAWRTSAARAGVVTDFAYEWRRHKIPPRQIAEGNPLQYMILDAVEQALVESGCDRRPWPRARTAAIVGTTFGGEFANQLLMGLRLPEFTATLGEVLAGYGVEATVQEAIAAQFETLLLERMPALRDETGSFTASSLASRITKTFDLGGGAVAVDAGHASSGAALDCAVDLLRSGDVDCVVCVGAQRDLSPVRFEALAHDGWLKPGELRSPWDAAGGGMLPAEGCGVVLLKRLADARRDGDPIQAVLRGIGAAAGAVASTASGASTDAIAIAAAIRQAADEALQAAGASPESVGAIETAPLGRAALDAAELTALADRYATTARRESLLLSTSVAQLGHAGAASGMLSLIKATCEAQRGCVAPTHGHAVAAEWLAVHAGGLSVLDEPQLLPPEPDGRSPLIAVQMGGHDGPAYHVLVERGACAGSPTSARDAHDVEARPSAALRCDVPSGASSAAAVSAPVVPAPAVSAAASEFDGIPLTTFATEPTSARDALSENAALSAIPHFDATERRREKMRRAAQGRSAQVYEEPLAAALAEPAAPGGRTGEPLAAKPASNGHQNGNASGNGHHAAYGASGTREDAPPREKSRSRVLPLPTGNGHLPHQAAPPASALEAQRSAAHELPRDETPRDEPPHDELPPDELPRDKLETFLVNFVVDQTGYPPEVVELDADLEADLGIDSIKKAQLFGELREYFDLVPRDDLSLDDFPTLRHVLEFLAALPAANAAGSSCGANGAPRDRSAAGGNAQPAAAPADVPPQATAPQAPAAAATSVGAPPAAAATATGEAAEAVGAAAAAAPSLAELETFLVNFVVDQTGYPPEVVELDADLEADLGIDSIKKAQLFGELREYFDLVPRDDLSLDDFPTLRHVVRYLASATAAT